MQLIFKTNPYHYLMSPSHPWLGENNYVAVFENQSFPLPNASFTTPLTWRKQLCDSIWEPILSFTTVSFIFTIHYMCKCKDNNTKSLNLANILFKHLLVYFFCDAHMTIKCIMLITWLTIIVKYIFFVTSM